MGAWQEIVDYTFEANETSRTFTNFGTITKDDFVKVVATINNQSGQSSVTGLYPNAQTTNTQYHAQILFGSGSSTGAVRNNENYFTRQGSGDLGSVFAYLKLSENDRLNIFSNRFQNNNTDVVIAFDYTTSSGVTFPSGITSFTLQSSATNGLGTGSRIQIYKLAAEKVADITVDTNSTQVNIPLTGVLDPAIDKDSEYLLVSDISNTVNQSDYYLTPNDLTTVTGYYHQRLTGNGSSASTNRAQTPSYAITEANLKALAYTHIKLSNIGAFTYQSYTQRFAGTSTMILHNYMGSSTSEAITSITKLNLRSQATNAIGSGSRFILYKLY